MKLNIKKNKMKIQAVSDVKSVRKNINRLSKESTNTIANTKKSQPVCTKNLRVNLNRLSRKTIREMVNGLDKSNNCHSVDTIVNKKKSQPVCIKNFRVNLTRLSQKTIREMINGLAKSNNCHSVDYNFEFKIDDGKLTCTNHPASVVPLINKENVFISIQKSNEAVAKNSVDISSTSIGVTATAIANHSSLNDYPLRLRSKKVETPQLKKLKPIVTTVAEIGIAIQKKKLWGACKKTINKSMLIEGSVVFAKQAGYAPWPSTILTINKSRTSASVKYHGYENFRGTVKLNEIVQIDCISLEAIGALVNFTLETKSIKDFDRFNRGVREIQGAMRI